MCTQVIILAIARIVLVEPKLITNNWAVGFWKQILTEMKVELINRINNRRPDTKYVCWPLGTDIC